MQFSNTQNELLCGVGIRVLASGPRPKPWRQSDARFRSVSHVVTSPPTPLADPSASVRSMAVCGLWRIKVPTAGPRRAHAVDNQHLVKAAGGGSLRTPCPTHHFHNLPQDLGETRSCSLSLASAPHDRDSTPISRGDSCWRFGRGRATEL